jgi:hypothetical protein
MKTPHTKLEITKRIIEVESQMTSCRDRIRDVEWLIEQVADDDSINSKQLDDRRKAMDKLRWLSAELLALRLALADKEDGK